MDLEEESLMVEEQPKTTQDEKQEEQTAESETANDDNNDSQDEQDKEIQQENDRATASTPTIVVDSTDIELETESNLQGVNKRSGSVSSSTSTSSAVQDDTIRAALNFVSYAHKDEHEYHGNALFNITDKNSDEVIVRSIIVVPGDGAKVVADSLPHYNCSITVERDVLISMVAGLLAPSMALMFGQVIVDSVNELKSFSDAFEFNRSKFEEFKQKVESGEIDEFGNPVAKIESGEDAGSSSGAGDETTGDDKTTTDNDSLQASTTQESESGLSQLSRRIEKQVEEWEARISPAVANAKESLAKKIEGFKLQLGATTEQEVDEEAWKQMMAEKKQKREEGKLQLSLALAKAKSTSSGTNQARQRLRSLSLKLGNNKHKAGIRNTQAAEDSSTSAGPISLHVTSEEKVAVQQDTDAGESSQETTTTTTTTETTTTESEAESAAESAETTVEQDNMVVVDEAEAE